jgi:L-lysine exporter family protein LysE/ArgO
MSVSALFQGWFMGLGLIMPIGAQNAYVLSQSIKRNFHYTAAVVCIICDLMLMAFGVFGGGLLIQSNKIIALILTWGGIIFLTTYGFIFLKQAVNGHFDKLSQQQQRATRWVVIATTLTMTLLNPHVYLDTVVIIGSLSGQFIHEHKIWFYAGTALASICWFFLLAYGSSRLSPWLNQPKVQQGLNIAIAIVMWSIALSLVFSSDNLTL